MSALDAVGNRNWMVGLTRQATTDALSIAATGLICHMSGKAMLFLGLAPVTSSIINACFGVVVYNTAYKAVPWECFVPTQEEEKYVTKQMLVQRCGGYVVRMIGVFFGAETFFYAYNKLQ